MLALLSLSLVLAHLSALQHLGPFVDNCELCVCVLVSVSAVRSIPTHTHLLPPPSLAHQTNRATQPHRRTVPDEVAEAGGDGGAAREPAEGLEEELEGRGVPPQGVGEGQGQHGELQDGVALWCCWFVCTSE